MTVYLEDNPPVTRQFRTERRSPPSGAIVVHTAENPLDTIAPDSGAENVARFISKRSDPGSYHELADSDTGIQLGRYEWEMFGEGTGGNRWALHLAFACRATDWPRMSSHTRRDFLGNGATAAAAMSRWMTDTRGFSIPAQRITDTEYRGGVPGFIGHDYIDPARRTDPGRGFPWREFLAMYTVRDTGHYPNPPPEDPEMPPVPTIAVQLTAELEALYDTYGGPPDDAQAWTVHLLPKAYAGEDMFPHLEFVEWALRTGYVPETTQGDTPS